MKTAFKIDTFLTIAHTIEKEKTKLTMESCNSYGCKTANGAKFQANQNPISLELNIMMMLK